MKLDKHLIISVIMFRNHNHTELISDIETEHKVQQFIQKALERNSKDIFNHYKYEREQFRLFLN